MKNENMSLDRSHGCPCIEFGAKAHYKEEVPPDRRVESLREVLANLACKLQRLLMLAGACLPSRSCGHVAAGSNAVLLCWPWQHYSRGDSSSVVLCNAVSIVVFVVVSRFLRASYP
jgi:hypothetical protein